VLDAAVAVDDGAEAMVRCPGSVGSAARVGSGESGLLQD
jgi:hypothetical protein